MYEKFFALTKAPFSVVPDPDCVHLTTQHADAISGLAFGVLERKGYLTLTAEAGLGKTTTLRVLSRLLAESNVESSVIFSPTLTGPEFLELAMLNFGFRDVPASKAQRIKMLEEFLIRSDADGKVMALIVDEAHQLSPELLEEVRLLGNFESTSRKLLQIVLVGQEELNDRLNLPQLWQLKQRITIRLSLQRLDRNAVAEYVRFRWGKAGGREPIPFSNTAIDAIATWSKGIPRLINVICENALIVAFSHSSHTVDIQAVHRACEELALPTPTITRSPSLAGSRPAAVARPAASASSIAAARPVKLTAEPPPPEPETAPAASANGWGASRPSLLKRWLQFASSNHRPARSKSSIFSLDEP